MPIKKSKEKSKPVEEVTPTVPTFAKFKNVTKRNVFTSAGVAHAGCEVFIPIEEGGITKGWKPCQK